MDMPGMDMFMTGALGISMDRMGSGTTWIPDAVSVPGRKKMFGNWGLIAHGFAFGQLDIQRGPRGDTQAGGLNWAMLMLSRDVAGGLFQLRTMLSLDALTVTRRGYPLLLQSGEVIDGAPIVDRQHPHDFWMELSALFERPISRDLGVSIYAAPSGEPALGPVAFMHRPSAMDDPSAPLSHHWQDATHISFGVATLGLFSRRWRLEASLFNGREPDEHRWNFDLGRLDSWSARFTLNPDDHWSLTAGYGQLRDPEQMHPGVDVRRATVSAMHGVRMGEGRQWTTSVIYGVNMPTGDERASQAVLVESSVIAGRSTVFGRFELVQKSADELVLPPQIDHDRRFQVASLSLGHIREVGDAFGMTLGAGARGTVNMVPAELEPHYGSRTPLGLWLFLRLRPKFRPTMVM